MSIFSTIFIFYTRVAFPAYYCKIVIFDTSAKK